MGEAARPGGALPPDDSGEGTSGTPSSDPASQLTDEEKRQLLLDRQRRLLKDGKIAYLVSTRMRVDEPRRVVVQVTGTQASRAFPDIPGDGRIDIRSVRVGSDLIAVLSGPNFEISRIGSDDGKRTLATGEFVEWQWSVRPLRSGTQSLQLVLFVRLLDESGPPVDVRTFDEEVEVDVNIAYSIGQFVRDYGAAVGIPTIVGIVLTAYASTRSGRKKTGVNVDKSGG
ncbi:MAG: hypothetical protein ACRDRH_18130 [Pseudonocardia sp.]